MLIGTNTLKNRCKYCHKEFLDKESADKCAESHFNDIIFLPVFKSDLSRLVNFIATGDKNLITERLSRTIFSYFKGSLRDE